MAPTPHYGLDIETDTTVDGLDPSCAPVVAVAVATPSGDEVLLGPEAQLLGRLESLLASLPPGVLVTWNGSAFDLPFLAVRAALHGVRLGLRLHPDPRCVHAAVAGPGHEPAVRHLATWGAHGHLDGYRLYRADVGRSLGLSCGLKAMARLTGIQPVQVDRTRIHELSPGELAHYVASDARVACQLVARRLPAAAAFVDRCPPTACAPGGSSGPPPQHHSVTPG